MGAPPRTPGPHVQADRRQQRDRHGKTCPLMTSGRWCLACRRSMGPGDRPAPCARTMLNGLPVNLCVELVEFTGGNDACIEQLHKSLFQRPWRVIVLLLLLHQLLSGIGNSPLLFELLMALKVPGSTHFTCPSSLLPLVTAASFWSARFPLHSRLVRQ